jgi:hypothetical protein
MGLQIWEEAKLLLLSDRLADYYFLVKKEGVEHKRTNRKLRDNILKIPTRELNRRWEHAKLHLSYARFMRHNDWFVDQKPEIYLPWYKEYKIDPIEEEIEILKFELDRRPPLSPKLTRKQERQERGKKNRAYGRCKNR